jgi:DNA polymerase-3 subunit delta'
LLLAQGWLCESTTVPPGLRPCGTCASCRLVAAHSHPDMLVLLPEALREGLGWSATDPEEGGEDKAGKKKPSKDIRVEEVRAAIALALTTSSRGRGKAIVIHPAERMNPIAANAFLKTLEEPAGDARFVLCSAAPDGLLPTIRSRCQAIALELPATEVAAALAPFAGRHRARGAACRCGGQPQDVLALVQLGVDAAAWRAFPGRVAAGDVSALRGWPLPLAADALQKLCHDAASVASGAAPRYFAAETLPRRAAPLAALLRWSSGLRRFAEFADHPWNAELSLESLVEQGGKRCKRRDRRSAAAKSTRYTCADERTCSDRRD